MTVRGDDSITLCQRALQIVTELCLTGLVDRQKCSDIFPLESSVLDISISLLAVVVGFCGLALLVVSLFNVLHVGFSEAPPPSNFADAPEYKVVEVEKKYPLQVKTNGRSFVKLQEAAMKISQTSPDIPIQRQTTEPTSSSRKKKKLNTGLCMWGNGR
uniref:Uncharacterized protein n=1 Tax=Neogobius melanostomus TaxID=47308 RepID=A0A8C6V5D4_9GOBI